MYENSKASKFIQRIETRIVRDGTIGIAIESPEQVVNYYEWLREKDVEYGIALFLGEDNECLGEAILAIGSVNFNTMETRDIIKYALLSGATKVILIHNHPSGTYVEFSEADMQQTENVRIVCKAFLIALLDHILILPKHVSKSWVSLYSKKLYCANKNE